LPNRLIRGGALPALAMVCALTLGVAQTVAQSALPSGWATRDIGSPGVAGAATFSSGTWTIDGGGTDIYGTQDAFRFAYQQMTGDIDITVRVTSLELIDPFTKAGLMIRESLTSNATNAFVFVTPSNGRMFQSRTVAGGSTTRSTSQSGAAPTWLRLTRRGNVFTGYLSADGTTWTAISGADSGAISTVQAAARVRGLCVRPYYRVVWTKASGTSLTFSVSGPVK